MAEVVGTLDGRILMGGKDGNIYELFYQAEDDWLESKCRLVNHSANIFSKFIPSFLKYNFKIYTLSF